ncbi:MAG: hypothetical protein HN657_03565 [Candidatus Marinimicrobia bacterium]|jgi:hypothetical protein|nr:hypothetical protein [Candidatus Neomarinimicrobiota bacterium]MBT3496903.1 hypothetical protein [Candidatus Neomarinimicrobiota bacterium]MBT3692359.1 hypothetical protein [Candidatus Neomarinimicrobiota bacterium]MBT3732540.1 hypothetical protein [Candidatus Neomarinimicrobiota bacterium]MBT4144821.1 hypothetical protein [Candidatus Neomarinimicrobiota bacterium]
MIEKIIQKVIQVMPIILIVMMAMMDRENTLFVATFLVLLFVYSGVLIARVLEAKNKWYEENKDLADLGEDKTISTMGDMTNKLSENHSEK